MARGRMRERVKMWGFISIFRDYKRAVLALMALSVAALYGAAAACPVDRPERAVRAWVALPQVTPEFEALLPDVSAAPQLEVTSVSEPHQALEALLSIICAVVKASAAGPAELSAADIAAFRKRVADRLVAARPS